MNRFWSEEVEFINIFDLNHLLYISILAVVLIILIVNKEKVKVSVKRIGNIILAVSILQQILLYSWYALETGFNISESLPLHICRISSLLGIYFLVTKNTKVVDTMFYFGLYAYGSFLYPSRVYPIYHAIGISFVINHLITILLPYFAYIAYNWRPDFKGFLRASKYFLIYFIFVYFLNPIIDGNYFYLKYRPFFKEWSDYIYIPFILCFTIFIFFIGYKSVNLISKITKTELIGEKEWVKV